MLGGLSTLDDPDDVGVRIHASTIFFVNHSIFILDKHLKLSFQQAQQAGVERCNGGGHVSSPT